jgi:hypothetical protein
VVRHLLVEANSGRRSPGKDLLKYSFERIIRVFCYGTVWIVIHIDSLFTLRTRSLSLFVPSSTSCHRE